MVLKGGFHPQEEEKIEHPFFASSTTGHLHVITINLELIIYLF